jgi:hypothetical protein
MKVLLFIVLVILVCSCKHTAKTVPAVTVVKDTTVIVKDTVKKDTVVVVKKDSVIAPAKK